MQVMQCAPFKPHSVRLDRFQAQAQPGQVAGRGEIRASPGPGRLRVAGPFRVLPAMLLTLPTVPRARVKP